MFFKQLFDLGTSACTYLIGCTDTGKAVLIDPVLETVHRDLEAVRDSGLTLNMTLETHIHADHITGGIKLKAHTNCRIAGPQADMLPCRDIDVKEGQEIKVGNISIHPLSTPGHTDTHYCYLVDTPLQKIIFTGDSLLIDGCGRVDFQSGDAGALYDSIQTKLFSLPNESLIYPAHDYAGKCVSTIGREKLRNPRLCNGTSREKFIEVMATLKLPHPKHMDYMLAGNMACGSRPANIPKKKPHICFDIPDAC